MDGSEPSCNLAVDERRERGRALRASLLPKRLRREGLRGGVALVFAGGQELEAELEALVAFERRCCGGSRFDLVRRGDALHLEIRGPDAALFEAALGEAEAPGAVARARTLLAAGGVGTGIALLVCCALPFALAAGLGIASLAVLDTPWVVAAVALLAGGGFYWRSAT